MDLESYFLPVLNVLDITNNSFNLKVVSLVLLLTVLGEATIQIPLLIESIWLLVGYQVSLSAHSVSVLNLAVVFLAAQAGRQVGMSVIYCLFAVINAPLSKFYMKFLRANKYYRNYVENEYLYNLKSLSMSSATLGMLTPLNSPIKFLLVVKRKPKILLLGTLLSGMAFDGIYIVMGAVFQATTLNLAYLPAFLLVGFLVFMVMKVKVLR